LMRFLLCGRASRSRENAFKHFAGIPQSGV
jgi:hypothetical protein